MKLYVVKDGIPGVGYQSRSGQQIKDGTFYLLTYDFKSNIGYVGKKSTNLWRLYTTIGSTNDFKSRYHHFPNFLECVQKLQELSGDTKVEVIESAEVGTIVKPVEHSIKTPSTFKEISSEEKELIWTLSMFKEKGFKLTPGAEYKLELLFEEIYSIPEKDKKFEDRLKIVKQTTMNQSKRIKGLQPLVDKTELTLIRPEDIPDLE